MTRARGLAPTAALPEILDRELDGTSYPEAAGG